MTGRIALVTATMGVGGAERVFANLASGLAATGREVDLVLGRAEGPHLAEVDPAVRVVDLGVRRFAQATLPLASYLRRTRPAAIYTAMNFVNVVAVAARALARVDARLVLSEHNTLSVAVDHAPNLKTRLMPPLVRRVYPRADAVVAVSRGVADDLALRCGLPSVHVLPNPVVTPRLFRLREQPVEHPWLRDKQLPVAVAAARFVPQKDFALLLDAFAEVRRARPARLVILGDGPLRPDLERQVTGLGLEQDVSLPGYCANPYPALAAADAFVLSSQWEGSPVTLVEAMACGTPVVSTDCPSGPYEALAGGRHGRLVPVGDREALAAGIVDALDGRVPVAPAESWAPFSEEAAVAACLALLEQPLASAVR